ncbi:MAG: tyrosine-type recombinase/integrase [bacterium]|nr:tyrosine-type recombinase/integrase [bacterium]
MEKDNQSIINHIEDFKEYLDIEKGLSNKSQETYGKFLDKFSRWLTANNLGKLLPHELTEEHIRKYRVFLSQSFNRATKEPIKRSTQNYHLIILRNLLNYFTNRDILALPAEKIKLIKEKERSVKFLNLDQIKRLLLTPNIKTLTGLRNKAILESFFSTGLRIAELVALNREQFIDIKDKNDLELGIVGKGGHPRTIYFSERALSWLKKYLETRKDKERALFINYKGPKKQAGGRLSPRAIENLVKKYALIAGCPITTAPHTIRHSFATDLLTKGVDIRIVQEFLGHRNIATTQIYTHVTQPQLRKIHRKFHGFKSE